MNRALAFLFGLLLPITANSVIRTECPYDGGAGDCKVFFPLFDNTDPTDHETTSAVAFADGDFYYMCDDGTPAEDTGTTITTADSDYGETGTYNFWVDLSGAELQCKTVTITIIDAAGGPVWLPATIIVDTFGDTSSRVPGILTSVPNNVSTANLDTAADTVTVTSMAANVITDTSLAGGLEIVFETDFATNYNTTRDAWETNLTDTIGALVGGEIAVGAFAAGAITDAAVVDTALGEATSNWATATGFPTVAEFNARTIASASYFDPAADPVANVTTVATLSGHTAQTADHTAGIADIPTVAEFNARTLVAASYFDPAADAVANVTLTATTTDLTNNNATMVAASVAGVQDFFSVDSTESSGTAVEGSVVKEIADGISGGGLDPIATGLAQSATATTMVLAAAETFADDELIGAILHVNAGAGGVGQTKCILDYDQGTDTATVSTWTTTPTGPGLGYEVVPGSGDVCLEERTLVAAAYFDPTVDAVADVTLVATTTTNSDMVSEPLDAAGIRTATGLASANLDTQITGLNTNIDATQTTIGTAGAGLTDLGGMSTGMQAEVEAEATDAIEADFLQYLFAATYDPASKPGQADALLNELIGDDSGVSQFTINALERAPSGTGLTPIATGTASAGAAGSITLAVAETFAADELNGAIVQLTGGTGAGQSRCITDYGVSADLAEVNTNWITNPVAASSTYEIWPSFGLCPDTTTTVASDVADAVWDEAKADHTTSTTFGDLPPAILAVDNFVDALETRVSFVIPGDATAIASDVIEFEGAPDAAAAIESEVDDALVVRELDHLVNVADADDPADNSIVAKLAADDGDWSGYIPANDSQEAIRDRGDANWETGTGTGLTGVTGTTQNTSAHDATTIQLESGEVVNNDDFLGWWIQITSGNCANQKAKVTASVASTDTVTVRPPLRTGAICTSLVTGLNSVTYELAPYGG